jgi:hypothetical protein
MSRTATNLDEHGLSCPVEWGMIRFVRTWFHTQDQNDIRVVGFD